MPTRNLPNDPNLDHLKTQAKTLLRQVREGDPAALALAEEFHPVRNLADAQVVIARSYGFASWPRLGRHLELVNRYSRSPHRQPVGGPLDTSAERADEFLRLATLHYGEDDPVRRTAARRLLDEYPEVALSNICTMVVAGELAAVRSKLSEESGLAGREGGPYRWEPLLYLAYARLDIPDGAPVEIAKLLLEHGADPNAGYLWQGMPSPFTAVSGAFGRGENDQPPHQYRLELARLLLEAGADPNDSQTMYNCGPGCPPPYDDDHLELLLEFGLGQGDGGPWHERMTTAHPTPAQLAFRGHRPYELAAVNGHVDIAELLLEAGVEPLDDVHLLFAAAMNGNRAEVARLTAEDSGLARQAVARNPYLPIRAGELGRVAALQLLADLGFDVNVFALTAPLHRAALNGHLDAVKKLIQLGADPTTRDSMYDATPQGWAEHNKQPEVVDYLGGL